MKDKEIVLLLSKYIDRFRFVAHRLGYLMQGYPENSFENITTIFENKKILDNIDGIEFDIRFTKDNVPIILHDSRTADISDIVLVVEKTNYQDLKDIVCGHRKTLYKSETNWKENQNFKLTSLEDAFIFFEKNKEKLGNKIIKIETKEIWMTKGHAVAFKNILNKYSNLNKNIVHLSFIIRNLYMVRKLQEKEGLELTKTDLLNDNKISRLYVRFFYKYLDTISFGIKETPILAKYKVDFITRFKASTIAYFSGKRNAVNERWMIEVLKLKPYIGIYTINDLVGIKELFKKLSKDFLDKYSDRIFITTADPIYLKTICK